MVWHTSKSNKQGLKGHHIFRLKRMVGLHKLNNFTQHKGLKMQDTKWTINNFIKHSLIVQNKINCKISFIFVSKCLYKARYTKICEQLAMQFDNVSCGGMITRTVTSLKMDWTRWKRMIDISLLIHDHDLGMEMMDLILYSCYKATVTGGHLRGQLQ